MGLGDDVVAFKGGDLFATIFIDFRNILTISLQYRDRLRRNRKLELRPSPEIETQDRITCTIGCLPCLNDAPTLELLYDACVLSLIVSTN